VAPQQSVDGRSRTGKGNIGHVNSGSTFQYLECNVQGGAGPAASERQLVGFGSRRTNQVCGRAIGRGAVDDENDGRRGKMANRLEIFRRIIIYLSQGRIDDE